MWKKMTGSSSEKRYVYIVHNLSHKWFKALTEVPSYYYEIKVGFIVFVFMVTEEAGE